MKTTLHFSRRDFVKSYIKNSKTESEKLSREKEANIIADLIEKQSQLVTKDDIDILKHEIKIMSQDTIIKTSVVVIAYLFLFYVMSL